MQNVSSFMRNILPGNYIETYENGSYYIVLILREWQ